MNVLVLVNVHVNGINIMLNDEKLDIYKVSIEFMAIALNIADVNAFKQGKILLMRIISMLTKLCRIR